MENDNKNMEQTKPKSVREHNQKKPLLKYKSLAPAPVRQTLTSYKRMLKANPLLRYQEAGIDVDQLFESRNGLKAGTNSELADSKTNNFTTEDKPIKKEFKKPGPQLLLAPILKKPSALKTNGFEIGGKKIVPDSNQHLKDKYFKRLSIQKPCSNNVDNATASAKPKFERHQSIGNVQQKKPAKEIKAKVNSFPRNPKLSLCKKSVAIDDTSRKSDANLKTHKSTSLRRSLSSGHIQSKQGKTFDPKLAYKVASQSHSEENLNINASSNVGFGGLGFSPILEEKSASRSYVFKTPSAYERRSVCPFTPGSVRKSSLFRASTPAPVELQKLQDRLNKWLKSRGKPLASFHHLRCFGINEDNKVQSPVEIYEENKENIEVINEKSESYESLNIVSLEPQKPEVSKETDMPPEELARIAKEAMVELQKLIQEDYPRAQCLGWLELIRDKYNKAVDEPEYWECRAAIEQSMGNVGNAVEFYKTAIIQGAEVTHVDKSLDQLLKKFSLLNISPRKSEQNNHDGNKERIIMEARNVFKSTIIQFAIQERKLKKKDVDDESVAQNVKKLVATPVRRSTRMSRSAYISTPGVKLCSSLKEANLSSEEIDFKKNNALC